MKISFNNKILDLQKPAVMGVLNITADSFYNANKTLDCNKALDLALRMQEEGADIIDMGAQATNPYSRALDAKTEIKNLIPVIDKLVPYLHVPISIDTSEPEVMIASVEAGAGMINDVCALSRPGALETAAKLKVPVCLMHMAYPNGVSDETSSTPKSFNDLLTLTINFFSERINSCSKVNISRERIILDPGFGGGNFGKSRDQNLYLLKQLAQFKKFNLPIMAGLSRKMFIGEILDSEVDDRLYGSLAAASFALNQGANILRVHDVKATKDLIKFHCAVMEA